MILIVLIIMILNGGDYINYIGDDNNGSDDYIDIGVDDDNIGGDDDDIGGDNDDIEDDDNALMLVIMVSIVVMMW